MQIDDSSWRLNFDLDKNKIHHYSQKEHLKISKIANFGREMLQNAGNIALQISQILYTFVIRAPLSAQKFTNFKILFLAVLMDFFVLSFCLDQNLVYSWNHLPGGPKKVLRFES